MDHHCRRPVLTVGGKDRQVVPATAPTAHVNTRRVTAQRLVRYVVPAASEITSLSAAAHVHVPVLNSSQGTSV